MLAVYLADQRAVVLVDERVGPKVVSTVALWVGVLVVLSVGLWGEGSRRKWPFPNWRP